MIEPTHETGNVRLFLGDCLDVLPQLESNSVDAIVTDPPYELGFMGKSWDATGIAYNVEVWGQVLRVLKPGGHLLAFSGSRTYHRMACAIEDAGFQIRDQIMWLYGSGFPKSLNVSKAIDKAAGALANESVAFNVAGRTDKGLPNPVVRGYTPPAPATPAAKQWEGWGTALKPAHEPIVLARKPLIGTVAANVLQHGTGSLNIDGSRVEMGDEYDPTKVHRQQHSNGTIKGAFGAASPIGKEIPEYNAGGRWPANVIHDGSDEVVDGFPITAPAKAAPRNPNGKVSTNAFGDFAGQPGVMGGHNDNGGSAARFFYCAKANKRDRNEGLDGLANNHPTVKPTELMRYLVKLITPPGGTILDPFTGSGSTGKAATLEGFAFVGIEQDPGYIEIANARIVNAQQPKQQPGLFDD